MEVCAGMLQPALDPTCLLPAQVAGRGNMVATGRQAVNRYHRQSVAACPIKLYIFENST